MNKVSFYDVPEKWAICLMDDCPMAQTCLRWQSAQSRPASLKEHVCVLPEARKGTKCSMYQESKLELMAWGMKRLFMGLKRWQAEELRSDIIDKVFLERSRYYRYRAGRWPITPQMQEQIQEVFQSHGITRKPAFDKYREQYYFHDSFTS